MGLFARLFGPAAGQPVKSKTSGAPAGGSDRNAVWVYVKCRKCGEVVALRLRKTDEIQRDCDGVCSSPGAVFFVRKEVMGTRCFNRMDLLVEFDANYRVVGSKVTGGELASREEYLAQAEGEARA
ncbi:MAG TPA: hypothetical protein GXX51_08360 [Firmicutes bacterium]|nr:hypothetical protein [Bacillota bacterium]